MENYGLVLAGGGCKGVYQIGVWRALREMGVSITAVVGTSVGAMNGALVALDRYDEAVTLWLDMSIEKGFALPEPLRVPDNLFHVKNADIVVKELFRSRGLDMSPLRRRFEELVTEDALRASPVEYGLVTFEVTRRQGRHLYRDQIPKGQLIDYIMASSAYPGIQRPAIGGKTFLDGGLIDNLPVKMLLRRHPDHVVVVDIGDTGLPRGLPSDLDLIYIKPAQRLGTAFAYQPGDAAKKMKLGWFDGRKAFGRLVGEWLYFLPDEYRRLRDNLGGETVKGLEIAARLYGLEQLEERLALPFARELLERDQAAALRLRDQAGRTDFPFLLSQPAELQLQVIRRQADEGHLRFRPLAQRLFPDTLRAADALARLRRYMEGED